MIQLVKSVQSGWMFVPLQILQLNAKLDIIWNLIYVWPVQVNIYSVIQYLKQRSALMDIFLNLESVRIVKLVFTNKKVNA